MSKPFAKLFDTPHGQLLAVLKYDTETDKDSVVLTGAGVNGVVAEVKNQYETEAAAQREFDAVDQEEADRTAKQIHDMINGITS